MALLFTMKNLIATSPVAEQFIAHLMNGRQYNVYTVNSPVPRHGTRTHTQHWIYCITLCMCVLLMQYIQHCGKGGSRYTFYMPRSLR